MIIGGGQTGLSLGYHLAKQDRPFVILEANERVGDDWRERFDSLRLYSPARYDGLPGLAFPADQWHYPTKDEVGDYLEAYAERFELPVMTGHLGPEPAEGRRPLPSAAPDAMARGRQRGRRVRRASRPRSCPRSPPSSIRRSGSCTPATTATPRSCRTGPVLVVGAAHSGADIALEVAREHQTISPGRSRGEVPFRLEGRAGASSSAASGSWPTTC